MTVAGLFVTLKGIPSGALVLFQLKFGLFPRHVHARVGRVYLGTNAANEIEALQDSGHHWGIQDSDGNLLESFVRSSLACRYVMPNAEVCEVGGVHSSI